MSHIKHKNRRKKKCFQVSGQYCHFTETYLTKTGLNKMKTAKNKKEKDKIWLMHGKNRYSHTPVSQRKRLRMDQNY